MCVFHFHFLFYLLNMTARSLACGQPTRVTPEECTGPMGINDGTQNDPAKKGAIKIQLTEMPPPAQQATHIQRNEWTESLGIDDDK
jgi:hypothetical protein